MAIHVSATAREGVGPPAMVQRNSGDLTPEERLILARLLAALDQFKLLNPKMPLNSIEAFLRVSLDEGQSVNSLAQAVGTNTSNMSRYLQEIGSERRADGKGMGLIRHDRSPTDLKRAELRLTERGRYLARSVVRLLRGGGPTL